MNGSIRPQYITPIHRNSDAPATSFAAVGTSCPAPTRSTLPVQAGDVERDHVEARERDEQHLEPERDVVNVLERVAREGTGNPVVRLTRNPRIAQRMSPCSGASGRPFAMPSMRRSSMPTMPTSKARPMKCSVSHSGQIHGMPPPRPTPGWCRGARSRMIAPSRIMSPWRGSSDPHDAD